MGLVTVGFVGWQATSMAKQAKAKSVEDESTILGTNRCREWSKLILLVNRGEYRKTYETQ
jgi:hypothetical protein